MKNRLHFITTLLLVLVMQFSFAQSSTITGTVTDGSMSLPGASVLVKGTSNGAATDFDGNFSITAEVGSVLIISYTGYTTVEVIATKDPLTIVLKEDAEQLNEVIVTALGISREKRSLGYAAEDIKPEKLGISSESNVVNLLSGQAAGVQVTGSSSIGGSSRIIIRGISSLSGNNQPLFVVDGTPMLNNSINSGDDSGRDYGNGVSDLNPDDIESLTVLKGANASALYGSRAANGVVLITTKKGTKNSGLGISFSQSIDFGKVYGLPNYQNEYGGGKTGFQDYNGELIPDYSTDESWGPKLDGTLVRQAYSWFPDDPDYGKATPWVAHPNNVKDFFETAINKKTSFSISGGGDHGSSRLSYTKLDQEGVVPNSSLARHSINLSHSTNVTDKLTVGANLTYTNTYVKGRPTFGSSGSGGSEGRGIDSPFRMFNQWFQRQVDIDRLKNYSSEYASNITWNITSPTNLKSKYWDNPYFTLNENYSEDWKNRIFGNVFVKYQITENISAELNARTDFYTLRTEARIVKGSNGSLFNGGEYQEGLRKLQENNYDALLRYSKDFSDDLSFTLNVGASRRDYSSHRNSGITVGGLSSPIYSIESSVDRPLITDKNYTKRVNSVYSSFSIGYKDLLYVDGSLRGDWSSTLPDGNNAYQYPSVNGSFIFSNLIDSNILDYGKIRGGWSKVGNDTDPYQLVNTFSQGTGYGSLPLYNVSNSFKNSNLKPEQTFSTEFGFDLKLLKMVDLSFTYYSNYTENQIMTLPVTPTSGYSSLKINAGKLSNKGVEVSLGLKPFRSENGFNWSLSGNFGKNTSTVDELYSDNSGNEITSVVINDAKSHALVTAEVGEPYGTFVVTGFERNDQGERLVGSNGKFLKVRGVKKGSYLPDWTGGLYNNFSYKNVSLSVNIAIQKGGLIYSHTNRTGHRAGLFAETVGLNAQGNPKRDPVANGGGVLAQGVLADGSPNTTYREALSYFKDLDDFYENFLYDASFIKLRDVALTYNVPSKLISKTPFKMIGLSLYGRNLAILHKNAPNIDPETTYGAGNLQGIENGSTPPIRSFGMKLNLKF